MPITVIIGGQFGGEGKGKVAHFFAQEKSAHIAVRVGGTNSGHTVINILEFL
jgi:adenylosuccinate synthase